MSLIEKIKTDIKIYWPCLLFLLAIVGFVSKALYNYPVAIMAILGLYKVISNPSLLQNDRHIKMFTIAFGCLWLPLAISLPDAVNFTHSSQTVFPYLRFLFAGIFIIDEVSRDQKRLDFILAGIFFIVLFWCLDATLQFIAGKNLVGYPYERGHITGMFYPRNTISHICSILSGLFFFYIFIQLQQRKWMLLGLVPLFFIILLSGRRAAWIMLALSSFGFLIYFYLASQNKKQVLLIAGTITTLIAVVLTSTIMFHKPTNHRFKVTLGLFTGEYEQINKATAIRLPIWETSVEVVKSNFINGIGPRGFRHIYQQYSEKDNYFHKSSQTHPHLLFMEILTETGIIGLAGYLLMIYLLIRIWRQHDKLAVFPYLLPVLVALFPLNAHMAFYGSIWSSMLWLLIMLLFCHLRLIQVNDTTPIK